MAEKRKSISNEQFLELKSYLEWLEEEHDIFYYLIKDIYGVSKSEMSRFTDVPEEYLPDENIKASDVLEKYPREIQEVFEQARKKIRSLDYTIDEFFDFVNDYGENSSYFFEEEERILNDYYTSEKARIIGMLNNSDLSQILPESFYDFKELENINLENSGANLDMDNFTSASISESIKGCNLISYNRDKHEEMRNITIEFGSDPEWDLWEGQWKKYLDESQRMEYYKGSLKCGVIPFDIEITEEEHSNLIEIYQDFFDRDDVNGILLVNLLGIIPKKIINQNQWWKDKAIKVFLEDDEFVQLREIIASSIIDNDLLKKYLKDIIRHYKKNYDNPLDGYLFFWNDVSDEERQIDLIDNVYEEILSNKSYSMFDRPQIDARILAYSASDKVKEKVVDQHRDESGVIKVNEISLKDYIRNIDDEELLLEVLDRYEEVYGFDIFYNQISEYWMWIPSNIANKLLERILEHGLIREAIDPKKCIEKSMNSLSFETYNKLLKILENNISKAPTDYIKGKLEEYNKYFRGDFFINWISRRPTEEIENNRKTIMTGLITKYDLSDVEGIDENTLDNVKIERIKELLQLANYKESVFYKGILNKGNFEISLNSLIRMNNEELQMLTLFRRQCIITKDNFETIIEGLPKLGEEIINRIVNNNSRFIFKFSTLILKHLTKDADRAEEKLEEIENIFLKRNVPNFIKFYKFFELLEYDESKIDFENDCLSPALLNSKSKTYSKRIIFSDLFRIAMDSNSKTLRDFIKGLKEGNEIYKQIMIDGIEKDSLSRIDKQKALKYIDMVYILYELSDAKKIDEREGKKLRLTGNIKKDFEILGKRYSLDGKIRDLPDRLLKQFIGPYQHLFDGIDTIEKIEEYMNTVEKANHKRIYDEDEISLQPGDMIHASKLDFDILHSILDDGLRAGEFLGYDSHSDGTPLDTDFSIIMPEDEGKSLMYLIGQSSSSYFGDLVFVLKDNKDQIEFSRKNEDLNLDVSEGGFSQRVKNRWEKSEIRHNVKSRISGKYAERKLEAFSSDVVGDHYGIRTGMAIGNYDVADDSSNTVNNNGNNSEYHKKGFAIILRCEYDKRIGYELAMAGKNIPVYTFTNSKRVFGDEDYKAIREKMKGLSYYGADDFVVSNSARTVQARKIVEEVFPDGNIENSVNQRVARRKRSAIERVVSKTLSEKFGLGMENHLTGNVKEGFVEFIDIGSTERGTNIPNIQNVSTAEDFDFVLRVDKRIMNNPNEFSLLKVKLADVLGVRSDDPECKIDYTGEGDFRFKRVKIEGESELLDIDVTFLPKDEELYYTTDMCVKDRLDSIKKTDPEGYKYTIANIILAKRFLKERGLYKGKDSIGATEYGGFGGVGVENWILQNGGSFKDAIDSFLENYEEAKKVTDSQNRIFEIATENYPILNFGENYKKHEYRHNDFISGLTISGFFKLAEELQTIREELEPLDIHSEKRPLVTPEDVAKADVEQGLTRSDLERDYILFEVRENHKNVGDC